MIAPSRFEQTFLLKMQVSQIAQNDSFKAPIANGSMNGEGGFVGRLRLLYATVVALQVGEIAEYITFAAAVADLDGVQLAPLRSAQLHRRPALVLRARCLGLPSASPSDRRFPTALV